MLVLMLLINLNPSWISSKGHDLRMNVSKNFTLRELVHSNHAIRAGISAQQAEVPRSAIVAMTALVHKVIQPARDHFGPIIINSAWRCKELNELLHSSASSDDCCGWGDGENGDELVVAAADIEVKDPKISNYDLAVWIRDNLEYKQLILENFDPDRIGWDGKPEGGNSGWVHISYDASDRRNEKKNLTMRIVKKKANYEEGIQE